MEIRCKIRPLLCALLIVLAMVAVKPLYAQDDTASALTDEENLVEQDNGESQESGESQEDGSTSAQDSQTEEPPKPMAGDDVLLQSVSAPEASIFTGTAVTRIPIKTPPARSVGPKIELTYNSSRNNSWVGVGWDLRMGAIQRSTKRGLHYDDRDFIVLTGESSFELVENPSWLSCAECYGAKIEESFTRYQRVLSPTELVEPAADGSWIATAKDGTKYYYGSTESSRQGNGYGTFEWLLDRIEDTAGNYATIRYAKENGEVYLKRIDYTANGALQPTNYVLFIREPRDDAPTSYMTFRAVKTGMRLKTVEVYETVSGGQPISRYELAYEPSPSSNRSLLRTVTQFDGDGNALPPVTIHWTGQNRASAQELWQEANFEWIAFRAFSWGATQWLADLDADGKDDYLYINRPFSTQPSLPHPFWDTRLAPYPAFGTTIPYSDTWQVADFNMDGLPDVVMTDVWYDGGHAILVMTGKKSGGFNDPGGKGTRIQEFWYNDSEFHIADVSGDGLPDIVYTTENNNKLTMRVFRNTTTGTEPSFAADTAWGTTREVVDENYGLFHLADVNGDSKVDAVYEDEDGNLRVMVSTGSGFVEAVDPWGTRTRDYIGSEIRFQMADANGDGLSDVVYTSGDATNNVRVLVSKGTSFGADIAWGTRTREMNVWRSTDSMKNRIGFLMVDHNGDGLKDFVYAYHDGESIQVMPSDGTRFPAEMEFKWGDIAQEDKLATVATGELDGDGLPDLACFWQLPIKRITRLRGGLPGSGGQTGYPDLLSKLENGIGGSYTIKYTPSSAYNNTFLPYVTQTVSSIAVNDGVNTYETRYTYEGGLHSYTEREFRGFKKVVQTLHDHTRVTTLFKQDDIFKGLVENQTTEDDEGRKVMEVRSTYNHRSLGAADFPYLSLMKEYIYDSTPEAIMVETSFAYDSYGNLRKKHKIDPVTGGERTDMAIYFSYPDDWVMSLPKTTYTIDPALADEDPPPQEGGCDGGVRSQQTCYTYHEGSYRLKSKKHWLEGGQNSLVSYEYDDYGNLVSISDPNGNPPAIVDYDAETLTFPWITTNPLGHRTTSTYDYRFGKPASVTDPNNVETTYGYDGFGRLKKVVEGPDDVSSPHGTVSHEYLDFGDLAKQRIVTRATVKSGPSGAHVWKRSYFDGLGRVTKTLAQGPEGQIVVTTTEYDFRGQVAKRSLPYFQGSQPAGFTEYEYDSLGRVEKTTNPDGTVVKTSYDKGWTYTIDANGHKRGELRDTFGNLRQVSQYKGKEGSEAFSLYAGTRYEYDVLGNLTRILDAAPTPNETVIVYDTLSRRREMIDPNMGHWYYDYDGNGNLTSQTDARNVTTIFQYDALNRITARLDGSGGSAAHVTYSYDDETLTNSIGRLSTVVDESGATRFDEYHPRGWVSKVTKTIKINGEDQPYPTRTEYDALGRVTRIIYPGSGEVVTYAYDATALKSVKSNLPITTDGKTSYADFSDYNALGQAGKVVYANGVGTAYTYDSKTHRLDTLKTTAPALSNPTLQDMKYLYDNVGNVTSLTDLRYPGMSQAFDYDELNRLTFAHRSADDPQTYTYDKMGNIEETTLGGVYDYGAARPYAVRSVTNPEGASYYRYDENGNMSRRLGKDIAWDYANRPASIQTASGSVELKYDYQGRRVRKTQKTGEQITGETVYVGSLAEYSAGSWTSHIFAGDMRIATKTSAGLFFYHTDHLGGTNFVTNLAGLKRQTVSYHPYGATRQNDGGVDLAFKFTGQEEDEETGLYYYVARYYDPAIGRFISADPILQAAFDPPTFDRLPNYDYSPKGPPVYRDKTEHYSLENSEIQRTMSSLPGRVRSVEIGSMGEGKIWNSGKGIAQAVDIVWIPGNLLNSYAYVQNNPANLVDPLGLSDVGIGSYEGNDGSVMAGNYEQSSPSALSVTKITNIIFNETRSFSGPRVQEARRNIAHVIMNGDMALGEKRPITAPSSAKVPTSESATHKACFDAVMEARAKRAQSVDPTEGAVHFNFRNTDSTSAFFGVPMRTHVGPLNNSYVGGGLNASGVWANTYGGIK